jgi:hypothetical protein
MTVRGTRRGGSASTAPPASATSPPTAALDALRVTRAQMGTEARIVLFARGDASGTRARRRRSRGSPRSTR